MGVPIWNFGGPSPQSSLSLRPWCRCIMYWNFILPSHLKWLSSRLKWLRWRFLFHSSHGMDAPGRGSILKNEHMYCNCNNIYSAYVQYKSTDGTSTANEGDNDNDDDDDDKDDDNGKLFVLMMTAMSSDGMRACTSTWFFYSETRSWPVRPSSSDLWPELTVRPTPGTSVGGIASPVRWSATGRRMCEVSSAWEEFGSGRDDQCAEKLQGSQFRINVTNYFISN